MNTIQVKTLMVPLADYATVDENATMAEAVLALEQSRDQFDKKKPAHRAILVTDSKKRVVGRISYLDFLQGLEPKYGEVEELLNTINRNLGSRYHLAADYTPDLLQAQIQKFSLWKKPLTDLCGKTAACHVKDFMHVPNNADFISEDASLDQAIHQFILIRTQSLLVRKGNDIIGILRLSDVAETIFGMIKECPL